VDSGIVGLKPTLAVDYMQQTWGAQLMDDPFYNPNQTLARDPWKQSSNFSPKLTISSLIRIANVS
jgi:hypothetical protein